jgi:putative ABC transport system permease protein
VAALDPDLRSSLFGSRDPIGRSISIAGRKFTVVGVRPSWESGFSRGGAWVPVNFYADLKHEERRDEMAVLLARFSLTRLDSHPKDEQQYAAATTQLREALLPMLPKQYRGGIKFSEDVPATLREFLLQNRSVAVRGAVGALAVLLVALIGLANMLLVSVHDELREIGLRRALGAMRPHIFLHFLSQGVLLSIAGAGSGLLVGAVACWLTRDWAGIPLSISTFWAAAGAAATVLAGTVTSAIPALLAARIHPVEALRYE